MCSRHRSGPVSAMAAFFFARWKKKKAHILKILSRIRMYKKKAGTVETGNRAGTVETGTVETGTVETGTVETGNRAGTVETGTVETGTVETGTVETGTVETGNRAKTIRIYDPLTG